jgi:poly[(R)-3-hydroxyalkanoate] polymerase subunit PhaC
VSRPDRRLAPRPLPAHLASAILLWLSSRAALTSLASGWPPWNGESDRLENLQSLIAEVAQAGLNEVAKALDRELLSRAEQFLGGLEAYRRHPFHRVEPDARIVWGAGNARLLDYGQGRGPGVLLVPSLINRYYVLDLLPGRSFARWLAERGLRPLVLDWGGLGETERYFTLTDYIAGPLESALQTAVALTGAPVGIIGYCMGGLLALSLALRRSAETACLALLATPWDFHAERAEQARLLAATVETALLGPDDAPLALDVIQSLFLALDPFLSERKFVRFAGLDPDSCGARDFVALEDWINDGVPLARNVALECARSWYRDNHPAGGGWHVAGEPVRPEAVRAPSLVVLPSRDRIVPPLSAEPLASAIPQASVLRPPFGHIGMMASAAAPDTVWQPIADWLCARMG